MAGARGAIIGIGATLLSKFLNIKGWTLINEESPQPIAVQGQFPATNLTREVGANWEQIPAVNRQNPILQFVHGNLDTISFQAQVFKRDLSDPSPVERLETLIGWTRIDSRLRRPPVLTFALGAGTGLVQQVVLASISGITYGPVNLIGGITSVTFTMNMTRFVKFDLDAEEVLDTRYAVVRDRDYYESLAQQEYGIPELGVILRQRNPAAARLATGDRVALPAIDGLRALVVEPQSIPLKTAFGRKLTRQRENFLNALAERSTPKFSFLHEAPRPGPVNVLPPNPEPLLMVGTDQRINFIGSVTRTASARIFGSSTDRGQNAQQALIHDLEGVSTGKTNLVYLIGTGTVEQNWIRVLDYTKEAEVEPGIRSRIDTSDASNFPGDIVVDAQGKLWVGCQNSGGLRRYDPSTPDADFEVQVAGINSVSSHGLAYHAPSDKIYAVRNGTDVVEVDASTGGVDRTSASLNFPFAITLIQDLDGSNFTHILVSPNNNAPEIRFVRISDFSTFTVSLNGFPDGNTDNLYATVWDPVRNLIWAANHFEDRILIIPFDPDTESVDTGNVRTLATPNGARPLGAMLYEPEAKDVLAIGQTTGDRVWFIEDVASNDIVHVINPDTEMVETSIPITGEGPTRGRPIAYIAQPEAILPDSFPVTLHEQVRVGTVAAWWEPSVADGVGQDVTAGRITRLIDRSGNGRHLNLSQGPGATLIEADSAFNDLPMWDFDRSDANIYDSSTAGFTFDDLIRENVAPLPQPGDYVTVVVVCSFQSASTGTRANPFGDNGEMIIGALDGSDEGFAIFQAVNVDNRLFPYMGTDANSHSSQQVPNNNGVFNQPRGIYFRKNCTNDSVPVTTGLCALLEPGFPGETTFGTAASGIIPQKANTLEVGGHAGSGPHPDMRIRKIIVFSDFLSRQSMLALQVRHIEAEGYSLV